MKFAIAAVVLLAVAMGVESSLIAGVPALGLGINGLGLGVHGLGINGLAVNGLAVNGLGLGLGVNQLGLGLAGHGLGVAVGVPGQSLSQGPALLAAAPAAINVAGAGIIGSGIVGHGGSYVAKTRGAIHTAPLPGHINSAASINLAPAPGTW